MIRSGQLAHLGWLLISLCTLTTSCGGGSSNSEAGSAGECAAIDGSPWVPRTSALTSSAKTISEISLTTEAQVIGYSDPALDSAAVTIQIPMTEDLGDYGSLTLIADVVNFPAAIPGGGVPMLVSLHDGQNEWISLRKSPGMIACSEEGIFECTPFGCNIANDCDLNQPSAYADLGQWIQHQVNPFAPVSVNLFPTCNWSSRNPGCAFTSDFFVNGNRLRSGSGVVYTARYLVLADNMSSSPPGTTATLRFHALRKKSTSEPAALNFNIVLVGTTNIQASRTPRGKANLDALVGYLENHYRQNGNNVSVGNVRVFEWGCEQGGDAFASLEADRLGELFKTGSTLVALPDRTVSDAVNIFLISDVSDSAVEGTLLGVAGGLPGSMISGTGASGVAIATFNQLDRYNSRCPESGTCPAAIHDEDFWTLGTTLSHEVGHFLGLNHPSEGDGREHDAIPDTPICTETDFIRGRRLVTVNSCLREQSCRDVCGSYDGRTRFCPEALECQFNHLMWWTVKNYNPQSGQGDGNRLSAQSLSVIRYSPFFR